MVSMMGMSVCAAGGVTEGTQASQITSVPVNKTVSAAENTYAPNTTFTFTVEPANATTIKDKDGNSVDVKAGITNGLKADQGATFT